MKNICLSGAYGKIRGSSLEFSIGKAISAAYGKFRGSTTLFSIGKVN
jgi:hypothetical protein